MLLVSVKLFAAASNAYVSIYERDSAESYWVLMAGLAMGIPLGAVFLPW